MRCKDQLNRILHFPKQPKTIVSLVPSITQLLVGLGLEDNIVGVTKFCVSPEHLRKEKRIIGGTKAVKADDIASLHPDIIIANKEENTKKIVAQLSEIAPVWVSDVADFQTHMDLIEKLSTLFQIQERGISLIQAHETARNSFQEFMKNKPWKRVYYLIWKDPYMVAGKGTYIDAMLHRNHFENCAKSSRYPEVDMEELSKADLLLLSSEPFPFTEERANEVEQRCGVKTVLVDGTAFSWYGADNEAVYQYFRTLH